MGQPEGRAAFSAKADDYAASRPGYPAALFDRLVERGVLGPDSVVADIGSGTGLFTRDLLARCAMVHAVEPNAEMRAAAEAWLGDQPAFRSVAAGAEATTLADASVDAVTVAQAFHWFDPEATRREFLRILRPDGCVVLVWNHRLPSDPLHAALDSLFDQAGGEGRRVIAASEDRARTLAFFGSAAPAVWEFANAHELTREGLLALVFSRSYMPLRATADGQSVADRANALFDAFCSQDRVVVRYVTLAFVGRPPA